MKAFIFVVCLCVALVIIGLAVISDQVNAPGAESAAQDSPPDGLLTLETDLYPAPNLSDAAETHQDTFVLSAEIIRHVPDEHIGEEEFISSYLEPDETDNSESNLQASDNPFELPLNGATGWAATNLPLRRNPQADAEIVLQLSPAQGFTIIQERGSWWQVQLSDGMRGWVEYGGCFINLPDVIPSIVYDITNSYSSMKRSSGYEIPDVTGLSMYDAWAYNHRLSRFEFIVPSMYALSRKLAAMQQEALVDGNTMIIYEVFRPRDTQLRVVRNLTDLVGVNDEVRIAINTPPWSIGSFIATSLSNHQRAAAVDASLGRVIMQVSRTVGSYTYFQIIEYEEYAMPSLIHELSPRAVITNNSATEGVGYLRRYFMQEGLTPVSSEWWHFDDSTSIGVAARFGIRGEFFIDTVFSVAPF